ncbi:MAG: hypothetical protein R3B09_16540 [Nannocystaceae bacterium]
MPADPKKPAPTVPSIPVVADDLEAPIETSQGDLPRAIGTPSIAGVVLRRQGGASPSSPGGRGAPRPPGPAETRRPGPPNQGRGGGGDRRRRRTPNSRFRG